MSRAQCEHCGEEFDNEYKLFRHEKRCTVDPKSGTRSGAVGTTGDDVADDPRVEGPLLRYFEDDGYGFAMVADTTEDDVGDTEHTDDVFVHIANTDTDNLEEGARLEFDLVENEKGLKAENATVLEQADERDETRNNKTDSAVRDPALRLGFGRQADDT